MTDSTALEIRAQQAEALGRPLPAVDDRELAALWRTAKALAESGLFKDSKQAGQAFAKVLAGRDLGLTPFEAMSALHVIEGKIEASADLHATRVRQREGYDYRVWWLKIVGEWDGKPDARGRLAPPVEAVAGDDEDPADLREVYGCAVEFTVDGERRGVGRWTLEDSRVSGLLDRSGPNGSPGNHRKFPRSMYYARAMSQGVSLHVPEVMGGVRVYALGEVPRDGGEDLTAGDRPRGPIGSDPTDALPTEVEAIIARARELGHEGLQDRDTARMAVGGGSAVLARWVRGATTALNRLAAARNAGQEPPVETPAEPPAAPEAASEPDGDGEPVDAEVVPERDAGALPDESPDPTAATGDPVEGREAPQDAPPASDPPEVPATRPTDEDLAVAEAAVAAAQTEGEATAAARRLAELRAAADPGQGRLV